MSEKFAHQKLTRIAHRPSSQTRLACAGKVPHAPQTTPLASVRASRNKATLGSELSSSRAVLSNTERLSWDESDKGINATLVTTNDDEIVAVQIS